MHQQQQHPQAVAAEPTMGLEAFPTQPNQSDVDEQMDTLMNEPFVQRIKDFFTLTLEKVKHDPQKRNQFHALCQTFDKLNDKNYEDPLRKIYTLVSGISPLPEIFVELLPEPFIQRIFPTIEASIVRRFDKQVKETATVEQYDRFVDIVLDNQQGLSTTLEFKRQLRDLFQGYPSLIEQLPIFFEEIDDEIVVQPQAPLPEPPARPNQPDQASKAADKASKNQKLKPAEEAAPAENLIGAAAMTDDREAAEQQIAGLLDQQKKAGSKQVNLPGTPKPQSTPIPSSLQKFSKVDVAFFLDRVCDMLRDRNDLKFFANLFALYIDGVLSQSEFYDLVQDLVEPSAEEQIKHLQTLVSQRDNSRRDIIESGQFKLTNMLTKSYYIFSDAYVQPICSGRFKPGEHALESLNDKYSIKTSGTEDYKFKIKNVHEDNLFKNEDEMYALDHQILQFKRVISKLRQEQAAAKAWIAAKKSGEPQPSSYEPKELTEQHFSFIKRFYTAFLPDQQPISEKKMRSIIARQPVELIENFAQRMEKALQELQQEKADKLAEWRQLCESNFNKSLDHRSFFFKKEQKDLLPIKKQLMELERIAAIPISTKSVNQLKGGSSADHEFFCTYSSFKINNIQVYTQADLEAPSLLNDAPINLRDPDALSRNPEGLPQMRFLLSNKQMLEMTFILLISGPQVSSNITQAEKQKIEDCLETLIAKFFRCQHSFKEMKAASKKIQLLNEEQIQLLTKQPADYYRSLIEDGTHVTAWADEYEKTNRPQTLELPYSKDESNHADDSQSNGGNKHESDNSSSGSSSDSMKRLPTLAEQKQLISLQNQSTEGGYTDQGLFTPAFKEGYSLMFGTKDLYMVYKTIASIYERLSKAQQLIAEKVDLDLKRNDIKELLIDKNELQRAVLRKQAVVERFKLFVNAVIGTLSQTPHKKLDPSNYEDIVRTLMGEQAFLLFVFDKLILQTLKNLPALKSVDECQRNMGLFLKFNKLQESGYPLSEHLYLTQFQQHMQQINNFSGLCVRLLYSDVSGILCVHVFNLNPFTGLSLPSHGSGNNTSGGTQSLATFRQPDQTKKKLLQASLFRKNSDRSELSSPPEKQQASEQQEPDEIERLRTPVFLNRNRRKMKQLRKHLWAESRALRGSTTQASENDQGEVYYKNGLVIRQVPTLGKLQYEANTEDIMTYKRRRHTKLSDEERAKADLMAQQRWAKVRELAWERAQAMLSSESQMSEERMVSDQPEEDGLDLPMNNSASGNQSPKQLDNIGAAKSDQQQASRDGEQSKAEKLGHSAQKAASAEKDKGAKGSAAGVPDV